jgi:hypothetical protein
MIKRIIIAVSVPFVSIILVLLLYYYYKKWENPLIAAGTVGAAVAAIWAVIYLEIIKTYFDRPIINIMEPSFDTLFYRRAPEIKTVIVNDKIECQQQGIGYYINILLMNEGKQISRNCQPLLTSLWKFINGRWEVEKNLISVPLRWAAGEEYENIKDMKLREERNLIPHRPYYFNLGRISTRHPHKFKILDLPGLTAQPLEFGPGEYFFEVTVTGEEVEPCVKYFQVRWDGGCTEELSEVRERFSVSIHRDPPLRNS